MRFKKEAKNAQNAAMSGAKRMENEMVYDDTNA
jgi:hypothetical protein